MATRTDITSGERSPKDDLLRWFVGPDGEPWPDWTGRARVPGRSVYTGRDAASVAAADARSFSRGARRGVRTPSPDALVARAGAAGESAWANRLGLARRAGVVSVGQAASIEAMRTEGWLMILAHDAGDSTVTKFSENASRKGCDVVWASGAWIGSALGREFVSVAIVARSPFSETLTGWARALSSYPSSAVRLEGAGGAR